MISAFQIFSLSVFLLMRATLTVNTFGCSAFLNDLAANVHKPVEKIVPFVTARIISGCIRRTPARSLQRIRTQVEFRNRTLWENGDPEKPKDRGSFVAGFNKSGAPWLLETSNWNGKGNRPRVISGKSFHPMEFFHWSDERWARWQSHLAAIQAKLHNVAQHLRSRGASKATWLQMAEDLGIAHLVKAPGFVKTAVSRDGRTYKHGRGREVRSSGQYYVEITNDSSLVVNRLNGAAILQASVNGELAYFYRNLELGVFDSIASISRRYPGITVL
jgi:hypothetical protein